MINASEPVYVEETLKSEAFEATADEIVKRFKRGELAGDRAVRRTIDGQFSWSTVAQLSKLMDPAATPIPQSPPPAPAPAPVIQKGVDGRYLRYEDVPWYRREPGAVAFIGVLFCGFVTVALCFICLTGDVYKKSYDKSGNLQVWGVGNKIAAVLILAIQVFLYWAYYSAKHIQ